MRFQALTAASIKMAVFWDLHRVVWLEVYRRFRSACCFHHQGWRVVCSFETLVSTYKSTRLYNPEDKHRYLYSCENLKSYRTKFLLVSTLSENSAIPMICKIIKIVVRHCSDRIQPFPKDCKLFPKNCYHYTHVVRVGR
jgi:hypothetical protein